ncbi:hypothetical protein, partial [Frankia nepalensis]|uniref:hypothetical protein n=1 Tax=Frankia nepalensis TaxID=1836974 RepID=UPI001EE47D17
MASAARARRLRRPSARAGRRPGPAGPAAPAPPPRLVGAAGCLPAAQVVGGLVDETAGDGIDAVT